MEGFTGKIHSSRSKVMEISLIYNLNAFITILFNHIDPQSTILLFMRLNLQHFDAGAEENKEEKIYQNRNQIDET